MNFNPRPPRGERLAGKRHNNQQNFISIHALREESDDTERQRITGLKRFQSTPSARRATIQKDRKTEDRQISIHALREESDLEIYSIKDELADFNPRPPRGERRTMHDEQSAGDRFQSTPSARRATAGAAIQHRAGKISIHALREESDVAPATLLKSAPIFQSTPSARRATIALLASLHCSTYFNPRPPRGERQQFQDCYHVVIDISIHALREESDVECMINLVQHP